MVFQALYNIVQFYVFSPCSRFSKYIFSSSLTELCIFFQSTFFPPLGLVHPVPFAFIIIPKPTHLSYSHPSSKNYLRYQVLMKPFWYLYTWSPSHFFEFLTVLFIHFFCNLELVKPSTKLGSRRYEVHFGDSIYRSW